MFIFGKKRKREEKTPKWFMWLMGGFLLYALLTNIFTDTVSDAQKAQLEAQQTEQGEQINFTVVRGLAAGSPALPLHVKTLTEGQGSKLTSCWDTVSVRYRLYNGSGEKVEDITEAEEPLRFTIGRNEVIPGLERGVLGMKQGAKRMITMQPQLAYGHANFHHPALRKDDYAGYILTLEDMQSPENVPLSDLGLRIYEDEKGTGALAQCTDKVILNMQMYDLQGRALLEEPEMMVIRIGEGIAPYAVERALMGMHTGGRRTVISPPGYMQPIFPLPDTEEEAPAEAAFSEAVAGKKAENPLLEEKDAPTPAQMRSQRWQNLPIPQDNVIILELELLRLDDA